MILKFTFSFRKDGKKYLLEKRRQQLWTPKDVPGDIKDIILEPHLKRRISRIQECPLCAVNYGDDPIVPEKEQELLAIEDHTSS